MAGKARRPRSENASPRAQLQAQSPGIQLPLTAHIVESPMKGAVQRSTQDGDGPLRSALGRGCRHGHRDLGAELRAPVVDRDSHSSTTAAAMSAEPLSARAFQPREAELASVPSRQGGKSMNEKAEKETWPDFAIVLFDLLTGRKAELTWEFENLELHVPLAAGTSTEYAVWKLNGVLKVRAREERPG
jgi:hypothetical protein